MFKIIFKIDILLKIGVVWWLLGVTARPAVPDRIDHPLSAVRIPVTAHPWRVYIDPNLTCLVNIIPETIKWIWQSGEHSRWKRNDLSTLYTLRGYLPCFSNWDMLSDRTRWLKVTATPSFTLPSVAYRFGIHGSFKF